MVLAVHRGVYGCIMNLTACIAALILQMLQCAWQLVCMLSSHACVALLAYMLLIRSAQSKSKGLAEF